MNKIFASAIMAVAMLGSVSEAEACTNFIVGKKVSDRAWRRGCQDYLF